MMDWLRKVFCKVHKDDLSPTEEVQKHVELSSEDRIAILEENTVVKSFVQLFGELVLDVGYRAGGFKGYSIRRPLLFDFGSGYTLIKREQENADGEAVEHELLNYRFCESWSGEVAEKFRGARYVWKLLSPDLKELKDAYLSLLELKVEIERLEMDEKSKIERQVRELEIEKLTHGKTAEELKE